jgi:hypothetical protein
MSAASIFFGLSFLLWKSPHCISCKYDFNNYSYCYKKLNYFCFIYCYTFTCSKKMFFFFSLEWITFYSYNFPCPYVNKIHKISISKLNRHNLQQHLISGQLPTSSHSTDCHINNRKSQTTAKYLPEIDDHS